MADLVREVDKHRPTRLIGMPVWFAAQLGYKRLVKRREQRCERVQAASQCPRRHAQPMIGQILKHAMTRAAIQEFVQQHADPYRHPELASLNQPKWGWRGHDARHAAAGATGPITPPADHAPVGLDLDLHHLAVFSTGEGAEAQTAIRTSGCVNLDELVARGQVRLHRASVTPCAALMPPRCTRNQRLHHLLTAALAALALAAKHALLQSTQLRVSHLELAP